MPGAGNATSPDSAATTFAGWSPKDTYWEAYRTVFVIASCESSGRVTQTELLYSYASPAESDSVRELVSRMRLEPEGYAGRMREDGIAPKRPGGPRFIVPVPTHGGAAPVDGLPSRAELEAAGLGPWLALCDDLLPDWPYEEWRVTHTANLRPRHPDRSVEDVALTQAGLVSISPDGDRKLHPFYSIEFTEEGRPVWDVDSGFMVYEAAPPHAAREMVGGTVSGFGLAGWIDDERYALGGTGEAGVSVGRDFIGYRVPQLWLGRGDSMQVLILQGPPFPVPEQDDAYHRLRELQEERYPAIR